MAVTDDELLSLEALAKAAACSQWAHGRGGDIPAMPHHFPNIKKIIAAIAFCAFFTRWRHERFSVEPSEDAERDV